MTSTLIVCTLQSSKMKCLACALATFAFLSCFTIATVTVHGVTNSTDRLLEDHRNRVPSVVHFVVGQGSEHRDQNRGTEPTSFSFVNHIILLAARRHLRPEKLYVHYYEEPSSFWWNYTKDDPEIAVTLVKNRLVQTVFNHSVQSAAHRSDVLRLQIIMQYGGIYLDTDVLVLRSFEPLLNLTDVVMASQDDDRNAVCTAVILANKRAPFIRRLYDAYQSFDDNCWDCHSVRVPGRLAAIYPNEVTILPTQTFFRPSYQQLDQLFELNSYNISSNYAVHLWHQVTRQYLAGLTADVALHANNTFGRMLRQAVDNDTYLKLGKLFRRNSQSKEYGSLQLSTE